MIKSVIVHSKNNIVSCVRFVCLTCFSNVVCCSFAVSGNSRISHQVFSCMRMQIGMDTHWCKCKAINCGNKLSFYDSLGHEFQDNSCRFFLILQRPLVATAMRGVRMGQPSRISFLSSILSGLFWLDFQDCALIRALVFGLPWFVKDF